MARYRIDATWKLDDGDPSVHLAFEKIEPLEPDHAQHLATVGMLRADDDPVGRVDIGELTITELGEMTPKRVRRAGLAWLAEHAGMRPEDSYELHTVTQDGRELLARIEAAVSA